MAIIALSLTVTALLIAIIALVVGGASARDDAGEERGDVSLSVEPEVALPDLSRRVPEDPTAIGDVDAPVVMVEWADYRCPFCGVFARDVQPQLVKEYVERGVLRIEWRDLPVFGEESVLAAHAGRAAGEQGLFWEFHDAVFASAPERGHAELPRERLIDLAQEVGIPDLEKFESDMDDPSLHARVQSDLEEGYELGVTSTPIFLVGKTPIAGAQPIEVFRQAVEDELERAPE